MSDDKHNWKNWVMGIVATLVTALVVYIAQFFAFVVASSGATRHLEFAKTAMCGGQRNQHIVVLISASAGSGPSAARDWHGSCALEEQYLYNTTACLCLNI